MQSPSPMQAAMQQHAEYLEQQALDTSQQGSPLKQHSSGGGSNSGSSTSPSEGGALLLSTEPGQDPLVLVRLFVGWVPKQFTEKDLTPLFNQFGVVRDIIILKDRVTQQPRGCAFVSYKTRAEAEAAIEGLDRKLQLPGALSPLEVRFAKSHQFVQAGSGPEDNRQLFFSGAPPQLNEQDISTFFSQFGVVEELNLFRERKTGLSKGCGFVMLQTRSQAVRAMEVLENKTVEPAQEMAVQWADPELQYKKKKALEESNADNRMLFFAKVLRSATEEDVKRIFSQFGKVYDVNLFRAFQGAPTTKGCGLITMGTHEEAREAIEGLDNKYTWEGLDSPMVVKWMDAALQRRRREQHLAAMRQGLLPGMTGPSVADAWLPQQMALAGLPGVGRAGMAPALILHEQELSETPPSGCAPDAIKLFVGNVPRACTEEQLMPFFETIGKVTELVIVRDKATHQSKGSAFVWYQQRAHAEKAILQFNLRHVLPDPAGEQDRPLVVRKARVRPSKAKPVGPLSTASHPAVNAVLTQGTSMVNLAAQPTFYTTIAAPSLGSKQLGGMHMQNGLEGLPSQAVAMQQTGAGSYVQLAPGSNLPGGYRTSTMQQLPAAQLVSIQAAPSVSEAGLYEAYGTGGQGDQVERYMISGQMPGQGQSLDSMSPLALSVPLNMQQLGAVNNHLYSVQSMSGAQLNVSPGAPGLFHLLISGSKGQVESARSLVSSILGQPIM